MAKSPDSPKAAKERKKVRTSDDMQLIKIVLDENPPLKERVLRLLERALGVQRNQGQ